MAKRSRRQAREAASFEVFESNVVPITKRPITKLKPLTSSQEKFMQNLRSYDLNFCTGVAGSGKSYCAAGIAAEDLASNRVSKIIVTRPAVEVDGEKMGFLPGELDDKFAPWFEPFRDILEERLGKSTVEYHLKRGNIVPKPLAYMRGSSFKNSWVIMDEGQNATPGQMKMFLTRIGEGCRMAILGDVNQTDLKDRNGMTDAVKRLRGIPEIGFHHFTAEDCVRHGLIKHILARYES